MTLTQAMSGFVRGLALRVKAPFNLTPAASHGGWFTVARIRESFAGAWQQNVEVSLENVLTHPTVFACVTLIAFDVAKLRVKLVQQAEGDIWNEVDSASFSPVLRKPNRYQNRIQFYETWMLSKLIQGNTYVLKERDARGVVVGLYVLDPHRVTPLVADDGSIYYELRPDNLARIEQPRDQQRIIVPASEIIHDTYISLYHPLVGVGPLHAAGVTTTQALHIQSNSTNFFANGATPGGLLIHPGDISTEQAQTMKALWETNFSGENSGRVAVLGGGLRYEPMKMMSAVDAQVVDQLKWSDEKICSAFHVPGYKVGVGTQPPYNSVLQRHQEYYSDCIQIHVEKIEVSLDEGLGLSPGKIDGRQLGTEFDLDGLMRMDPAAQIEAEAKAVAGSLKSVNEARRKLNHGPKSGGDAIYLQQQYFSIEALAERDSNKPFAQPTQPTAPARPDDEPTDPDDTKAAEKWRLRRAIDERLMRAA